MVNSDNKVFDLMTAAADKTAVDLFPVEFEKSTDSIHNALMAAGMTPAYGNVADLADAALYALEGEFGEAAWSSAAALPVIGQMVSAKKALRFAKEAGEEMVTLYRGIPDWFPGEMVKEGKFVSPQNLQYYGQKIPQPSKKGIFVGTSIDVVEGYSRPRGKFNMMTGKRTKPAILEFEVPKSWFDKKLEKRKLLEKYYKETTVEGEVGEYWIDGGIPKEFLKKVHKSIQKPSTDIIGEH
jgi:hypothetical protein